MREVLEETGIYLERDNLIDGTIRKSDNFTNREFCYVYYYNYSKEPDTLKFNDGEVQTVKWMTARQIKKSMQENPANWAGRAESFEKAYLYLKKPNHTF